jgi:hypothetical protein
MIVEMKKDRLKGNFVRPILIAGLVLLLLGTGALCSASSLDQYLHKNCRLESPSELMLQESRMKPISPREAASFAVRRLQARGVKNIVICEAFWIAAAVSGYLIHAKGKALIDGDEFSSFRVGIRDGLEERNGQYAAGEEFVFIARGEKNGQSVWYPPPGPDYELSEGQVMTEGMLAYEFLGLHRKAFERLAARYP